MNVFKSKLLNQSFKSKKKIFFIVYIHGFGFQFMIENIFLNSSSSSTYNPFEFLRTHASRSDYFSYFPFIIHFVIILTIFIIAWIISKRRKKKSI